MSDSPTTQPTTETPATESTTERVTNLQGIGNAPYYGNLARVAAQFYIATGNDAELTAAYWYARYAGHVANQQY